jgi:hypothetical protein
MDEIALGRKRGGRGIYMRTLVLDHRRRYQITDVPPALYVLQHGQNDR